MSGLHIDELNLRVRGNAGGDPHALARVVAETLLRRLHCEAPIDARQLNFDAVTVPPVRLPKHLTATHARHEIAAQVARSVVAHVRQSSRSGREK